ncbi:MAG: carboxyl-terminal processing protease [Patiriisocius sp.]|jgi:carboxyl-terminal processing protease
MKSNLFSIKRRIVIFSILIAGLSISATVSEDFFEISKNLEIFSDLYKKVNLYYSDDTKPGELMKIGVDAMLKSLDPYTVYIPESRMEDYRMMTTGQYGGVGASIKFIDNKVVITDPYEGFPAHKAGIQAGDIVKKVDGKTILDMDHDQISELLKGQAGTSVSLSIERYGDEMSIDLVREDVQIPNVPYYGLVNEDVGYVKLNKFTKTASREIKAAYVEMQKQGMEKLILDLRGNTGGLLGEAINIVNFFVPKETPIVSTKGRLEEWDKTYIGLNEPLSATMPLVVLVDGTSASASEVVSGALQDLDRAVIIGTETYGKGLVQQTKDIAYNSKIKLTVAKYYTPSGRCIQKLDYFNKVDGLAEEVPDDNIAAFKTANGREVFDGRGIKPDVVIENENLANIVYGLFEGDHIFNYATLYKKLNSELSGEEKFQMSDTQYDEFLGWVKQQNIEYSNESETIVNDLIEVAKSERYYDLSAKELEELKSRFKPNVDRDLVKFKDQVTMLLNNEIVSRYYYQVGRIKNVLSDDPYMDQAYTYLQQDKMNSVLKN